MVVRGAPSVLTPGRSAACRPGSRAGPCYNKERGRKTQNYDCMSFQRPRRQSPGRAHPFTAQPEKAEAPFFQKSPRPDLSGSQTSEKRESTWLPRKELCQQMPHSRERPVPPHVNTHTHTHTHTHGPSHSNKECGFSKGLSHLSEATSPWPQPAARGSQCLGAGWPPCPLAGVSWSQLERGRKCG